MQQPVKRNNATPKSYESLTAGGDLLNRITAHDDSYPDLWDNLYNKESSGHGAGEYLPANQYSSNPLFYKKKDPPVDIPKILQDQLAHSVKYKTFSGLFTELNRAFLTIDHKLFLWNYEARDDFITYDDLEDVIISVALVAPKPGIFIDSVKYLVAIATTVEIVLLALIINDDNSIMIGPTHYNVATDNVKMLKIIGTQNGRIFLCGADGCVYEVEYNLQDGWFGFQKKMRKLNKTAGATSYISQLLPFFGSTPNDPLIDCVLDRSRNLLYTLSEKSAIQVYHLGREGDQMNQIAVRTDIAQVAQKMVQTPGQQWDAKVFQIIHLAPIEESESSSFGLVAITRGGFRYYFTLSSDNFKLAHVRFIPLQERTSRPSGFQSAFYSRGVCFLIEPRMDADVVLGVAPDVSPIPQSHRITGQHVTLVEKASNVTFEDGKLWEIAEVPESALTKSQLLSWQGRAKALRQELANQHQQPPRHFMLFSGTSIQMIVKSRPIDDLRSLLAASTGESQALSKFKDKYGVAEFCSMCLILATEVMPVNEPGFSMFPAKDNNLIKAATQAFFTYAGQPSLEQGPMGPNIKYSGTHDGFVLLFARIIRPLARTNLFNNVQKVTRLQGGQSVAVVEMVPYFNRDQLFEIERKLKNLKQFLVNNNFGLMKNTEQNQDQPDFPSMRAATLALPQRVVSSEATKLQETSLANLHSLLTRSIEALAFLRELLNYPLGDIVQRFVSPKGTNILSSLVFMRFVATKEGVEIHKELVNAIIQLHAESGRQMNVDDSIVENLAQQCPSWFSDVDRIRISGLEFLCAAQNMHPQQTQERRELLEASLKKFEQITTHLVEQRLLEGICGRYGYLRYFKGIVKLCLKCARDLDPMNLVLRWHNESDLPPDGPSAQMQQNRISCYTPICKALTEVIGECVTAHGQPQFSKQEWLELRNEIFRLCRQSDDELFHYHFYKWYLSNNLPYDLIKLDTKYLEEFLKRKCQPKSVALDLLARYYIIKDDLAGATLILMQQSEQTGTDLTLEDRVNLLSRALTNAKGAKSKQQELGTNDITGDLLKKLEDKIELAMIQLKVSRELDRLEESVRNTAKAELSSKLFGLSDLYNSFALKYGLHESALALLKSAGYNDPNLVRALWINIIQDIEMNTQVAQPLTALKSKIIQLGKEHYPSDIVFPLDDLVRLLEERTQYHQDAAGFTLFWVAESMIEIGVPFHVLFAIYDNLLDRTEGDRTISLLLVLSHILEGWHAHLSRPGVQSDEFAFYRSTQITQFTNKAKDILTAMGLRGDKMLSHPDVKECERRLGKIEKDHPKFSPAYQTSFPSYSNLYKNF